MSNARIIVTSIEDMVQVMNTILDRIEELQQNITALYHRVELLELMLKDEQAKHEDKT